MSFIKKYSFLLILLTGLSANGVSQIRFNKMYDFQGAAEYASVVHETAYGYLVIGAVRDTATWLMGIGVLRLDEFGNELEKKVIPVNPAGNFSCLNSVYSPYDSTLLVVGTHQFPSLKIAGTLTKFTLMGDTVFHKIIYDTTYNSQCNDILRNEDGTLIIAGSTDKTDSTVDAYLMKTDSMGNIIWEQNYVAAGTYEICLNLDTAAGGFVLGTGIYSYTTQFSRSRILFTDSAGNLIWEEIYGSTQYNSNVPEVVGLKNNRILSGASMGYNYFSGNLYQKPEIRQYDTSQNVEWNVNLYSDRDSAQYVFVSDVLFESDSSVIFSLTLGDNYRAPMGIVKINLIDTSVVWMRSLIYIDWIEYTNSIIRTSDSGYLVVGWNNPYLYSQNMRVIKVDQYGCDTANCHIYDALSEEKPLYYSNNELMLFPNPASDKLYIDFKKMPISAFFETRVEVYDLTGKLVITQSDRPMQKRFEVDVSSLAPGTYIIQTIHNGYNAGKGRFVKQ